MPRSRGILLFIFTVFILPLWGQNSDVRHKVQLHYLQQTGAIPFQNGVLLNYAIQSALKTTYFPEFNLGLSYLKNQKFNDAKLSAAFIDFGVLRNFLGNSSNRLSAGLHLGYHLYYDAVFRVIFPNADFYTKSYSSAYLGLSLNYEWALGENSGINICAGYKNTPRTKVHTFNFGLGYYFD